MITIRPYRAEDRPALLQLMDELQELIAAIDPLHRIKVSSDFNAGTYVDHLLAILTRDNGSLLVAEEDVALLGFIAGSVPEDTDEDLLDHYPAEEGKIHELVVSEKYREEGIGRLLIEKMEKFFRDQGCAYVRVGCFTPNKGTHAFYEKCDYSDRYVEMLKQL